MIHRYFTPFHFAITRGRVIPPGSPRRPERSAAFTICQVSPGASGIGPEFRCGQFPRSDSPFGNPRPPVCNELTTISHVSNGASGIGPVVLHGQRPVRWKCASAHRRIAATVSFGRLAIGEIARSRSRSLANVSRPGRPRVPCRSALSIPSHDSAGDWSSIPECLLGQVLVRRKWRSAQFRIFA